jgi:uncharacterized protein YndB with AHSA1/START domain
MTRNLVAKAATSINADKTAVWKALTSPETIKKYMFGADVESAWQVGSPITWRGEWKGKPFEDKGVILRFEKDRTLQYSHFSPRSGDSDTPENYHTVTIDLSGTGKATDVSLVQDGNADAKAQKEAEKNWNVMLAGLKELVEAQKWDGASPFHASEFSFGKHEGSVDASRKL